MSLIDDIKRDREAGRFDQEAHDRRVFRVPDMEAALLAAEELADVVNLWREALSDKVLIPLEVHTALAAFQKAVKQEAAA